MAERERSARLHREASKLTPGGVSSPVRAFGRVGTTPVFASHGQGSRLHDVDGNAYIDFVMSWGALMLGHAHPDIVAAVRDAAALGTSFGMSCAAEAELASMIIESLPGMDMVRFVNSGTEATMSAVRLARATTGRDVILKFSGCYHGHADAFLAEAGSGVATLGLPGSPGVPDDVASSTLTVRYNDRDAVRDAFDAVGARIACVIVEPVCGNAGFIPPVAGFLQGLREITREHGALLIFDEVMTGFRVGPGGAQRRFEVEPDLTTLGKVIGGGLPVGAYGGRAALMERIAPAGPVYQAGTLSGNPLAMAAGIAQLRALRDSDPYPALEARARRLVDGVSALAAEHGLPFTGGAMGAMFGWFLVDAPVRDIEDARRTDDDLFARLYRATLDRGVLFAPSPFEASFISTAHTDQDIDTALDAMRAAFEETMR